MGKYDYDYHETIINKTYVNAPLYGRSDEDPMFNVNDTVNWYIDEGAPSMKLLLGLGLYGRGWEMPLSGEEGIDCPARGTMRSKRCSMTKQENGTSFETDVTTLHLL